MHPIQKQVGRHVRGRARASQGRMGLPCSPGPCGLGFQTGICGQRWEVRQALALALAAIGDVTEGIWMVRGVLANGMGRGHGDTELLPTVAGAFSSANRSTWTSVQIIVFNYHLCIPSHATY